MKPIVLDSGVVVAGVFWRNEPHTCLKAWLNSLICPVVSGNIFAEYERVLREQRVIFQRRCQKYREGMKNTLKIDLPPQ